MRLSLHMSFHPRNHMDHPLKMRSELSLGLFFCFFTFSLWGCVGAPRAHAVGAVPRTQHPGCPCRPCGRWCVLIQRGSPSGNKARFIPGKRWNAGHREGRESCPAPSQSRHSLSGVPVLRGECQGLAAAGDAGMDAEIPAAE